MKGTLFSLHEYGGHNAKHWQDIEEWKDLETFIAVLVFVSTDQNQKDNHQVGSPRTLLEKLRRLWRVVRNLLQCCDSTYCCLIDQPIGGVYYYLT